MSNTETDNTETDNAAAANKEVAEAFWATLARRDFDALGEFIAPDGHYVDVPVLGDGAAEGTIAEGNATEEGATGPEEVIARLRLGLEPLEKYVLHDGRLIAEGNTVVTEHSEEWFWHTGEHHHLRFCSIQEFADGKIRRWWDYMDLNQLLQAAPDWWIEHITDGYK